MVAREMVPGRRDERGDAGEELLSREDERRAALLGLWRPATRFQWFALFAEGSLRHRVT
ncbi:MAG: hypothetical protein ACO3JL_03585 [Myxococcota bacterium]